MSDLFIAMAVMAAASGGVFFLVRWLFRPLSRGACLLALLVVIAALVFYLRFQGQDQLAFAQWLPVSAVVIYANFTPLITAAAAAIIWHALRPVPREAEGQTHGRQLVRRTVLIVALWGIAAFQAWHIIWAEAPPLGHRRSGPIWRQTTQASCSPAAAATLLTLHGIRTSEVEMARLCLTTRQGTRTLGVFRGLTVRTRQTHRVETYTGDVRGLRAFATSPVLINVGLDAEDAATDSRFVTDWGWQPGARHTVVVLEWLPDDRVLVADPAVGVERWTVQTLEVLWQAEAFRLTPRP